MEQKGWKLVTPDSWANLEESISKAVANGQNWFGYYWSPSAAKSEHNIIKLDFEIEFAGNKNWFGCIAKSDCEDPQPSAWNQQQRQTVVNDKLIQAVPSSFPTAALDYLRARVVPGDVMSTLLALRADKQLSAKQTAKRFLVQHTDTWKSWVSADIADRIFDSLATLHWR